MKVHKRSHAIFAGLILLVFTAGIFTLQQNVARSFSQAKKMYEQVSAVNATLALSVTGDIAAGKDPSTLKGAFVAARERQEQAAAALVAARHRWMVFGAGSRAALSDDAKKETTALFGVANAVDALAALPQEEWSSTIVELHEQTDAFQVAHQEILKE